MCIRDSLESFSDINGWHILKNVPEAEMDQIVLSQQGAKSDGSLLFAWGTGNPMVARGIYPGLQLAPIPALASQSFLSNSGHSMVKVRFISFLKTKRLLYIRRRMLSMQFG